MPTKYSLKYALLGLVLAGVTASITWFLPDSAANIILAFLLSAASVTYLWYAIVRKDTAILTVESIMIILFILLAVVGCTVSPIYLVLGFLLHGFWDLAHHPRYIRSSGPAWYQPMCLAFDWGIAAYIVVRVLGAKN
jgi:hypothetical protein